MTSSPSPVSSSPTSTPSNLWLNHPTLRPGKSEREKASSLTPITSPTHTKNKKRLQNLLLVLHGAKIKTKRGREHVREIKRSLEKHGMTASCVHEKVTTKEGDCIAIVRDSIVLQSSSSQESPNPNPVIDAIFVMGGDGTLREAVQGYVEARRVKPLGVKENHVPIVALPCGTGNNFARDLNCFTIEDCFRLAFERGEARDVDAVQIESFIKDDDEKEKKKRSIKTISINVVTWGMARDAAETAEKMRFLGPIRYDLAGFYHILKNKSNVASLTAETPSMQLKGSCTDDDFLMLFAQNTRCSGRGFHFTPLAKLDDGLIDVVVAKKCGLMKTVALFDDTKEPKRGAHVEKKDDVFYIQCEKLKIETHDREELVGVDGEVTLKTPVELECLRGAFSTFV